VERTESAHGDIRRNCRSVESSAVSGSRTATCVYRQITATGRSLPPKTEYTGACPKRSESDQKYGMSKEGAAKRGGEKVGHLVGTDKGSHMKYCRRLCCPVFEKELWRDRMVRANPENHDIVVRRALRRTTVSNDHGRTIAAASIRRYEDQQQLRHDVEERYDTSVCHVMKVAYSRGGSKACRMG
jgi:hypothetical protein